MNTNALTNTGSEVAGFLGRENYLDAMTAKNGVGECLDALRKLADGLANQPETQQEMKDLLIALSSHTGLITRVATAAHNTLSAHATAMDGLVGLLCTHEHAVNSVEIGSLLSTLARQEQDVLAALEPVTT